MKMGMRINLAISTSCSQLLFITYIIKTKRASPRKRICSYCKTISHEFFGHDTCVL